MKTPSSPKVGRRAFLNAATAGAVALCVPNAQAQPTPASFGSRRIYYNNFASHLLNAYNPNVFYPKLPHRWSDDAWRSQIDMIADFGFNAFEFWLEPSFFCREGIESERGRELARQMNVVIARAHERKLQVHGLICMATTGEKWHTLCPNDPSDWAEIRRLWDAWTRLLPEQDVWTIFPGDPGACSRNGCTALTFIDRAVDIGNLVRRNCPNATVEINTWGPPIFGWGIIEQPPNWKGEFARELQASAWRYDQRRTDECMEHLIKRLPDFGTGALVSMNMGFDPDGNPEGAGDARKWVNEVAKTNEVLTWDFSLTEGEAAVFPHGRLRRLFAQRNRERSVGGYSGGICFTMTPLLNQCSHYCAAQSFLRPDADPFQIAGKFFSELYGDDGAALARYLPLFEIVRDWGDHVQNLLTRTEYHERMVDFNRLLADLRPNLARDRPMNPRPEQWHEELAFFGKLFADATDASPDVDGLKKRYRSHVYSIYEQLPGHVDPRADSAVHTVIESLLPNRWPSNSKVENSEWTTG